MGCLFLFLQLFAIFAVLVPLIWLLAVILPGRLRKLSAERAFLRACGIRSKPKLMGFEGAAELFVVGWYILIALAGVSLCWTLNATAFFTFVLLLMGLLATFFLWASVRRHSIAWTCRPTTRVMWRWLDYKVRKVGQVLRTLVLCVLLPAMYLYYRLRHRPLPVGIKRRYARQVIISLGLLTLVAVTLYAGFAGVGPQRLQMEYVNFAYLSLAAISILGVIATLVNSKTSLSAGQSVERWRGFRHELWPPSGRQRSRVVDNLSAGHLYRATFFHIAGWGRRVFRKTSDEENDCDFFQDSCMLLFWWKEYEWLKRRIREHRYKCQRCHHSSRLIRLYALSLHYAGESARAVKFLEMEKDAIRILMRSPHNGHNPYEVDVQRRLAHIMVTSAYLNACVSRVREAIEELKQFPRDKFRCPIAHAYHVKFIIEETMNKFKEALEGERSIEPSTIMSLRMSIVDDGVAKARRLLPPWEWVEEVKERVADYAECGIAWALVRMLDSSVDGLRSNTESAAKILTKVLRKANYPEAKYYLANLLLVGSEDYKFAKSLLFEVLRGEKESARIRERALNCLRKIEKAEKEGYVFNHEIVYHQDMPPCSVSIAITTNRMEDQGAIASLSRELHDIVIDAILDASFGPEDSSDSAGQFDKREDISGISS